MKKIMKSKWKNIVGVLLVAVLFVSYIAAATTVKLADETGVDVEENNLGLQSNQASSIFAENMEEEDPNGTSYTVELKQASNWALTNRIASKGPITLSYKVESATAAVSPSGSNVATGVIATTTPAEQIPWNSGGTIQYDAELYKLMKIGRTYTITIGLDSDNKVTFSGSYTEDDGATTEFDTTGDLLTAAGTGTAECQYFGLYVALIGEATLTNVTCVDAEGNNLGLQSNQSSCTITKSQESVLEPELSIGDANGDGVFGAADIVRYKRVLADVEGDENDLTYYGKVSVETYNAENKAPTAKTVSYTGEGVYGYNEGTDIGYGEKLTMQFDVLEASVRARWAFFVTENDVTADPSGGHNYKAKATNVLGFATTANGTAAQIMDWFGGTTYGKSGIAGTFFQAGYSYRFVYTTATDENAIDGKMEIYKCVTAYIGTASENWECVMYQRGFGDTSSPTYDYHPTNNVYFGLWTNSGNITLTLDNIKVTSSDGLEGITFVNEYDADLNDDGTVNADDTAWLREYLVSR